MSPTAVDESRLDRWLRRAVVIPFYGLLAVIGIGGLPLWLPLAAAVDLLRRAPWTTVRCVVLFALFLGCELIGIAASLALFRPRPPTESDLDRHYA